VTAHPSCNDPENHLTWCAHCRLAIEPGDTVHRLTFGGLSVDWCSWCERNVDYRVGRTRVETRTLTCPCVRMGRTRSLRRAVRAA
jgi:hypothetical protein